MNETMKEMSLFLGCVFLTAALVAGYNAITIPNQDIGTVLKISNGFISGFTGVLSVYCFWATFKS